MAFSIVPDTRLREGNSIDHTRRQIGRIVAQVHRDLAGLGMAIAAFDISANESLVKEFRPHYQPQVYGVARRSDWLREEPKLRKRFPASDAVYIPVRKRDFDGNPIVYAYTLKPNFDRRVTLPAVEALEAGIRGIAPQRQRTKARSLRLHQDAELRMILHQLGLDRRLILIGTTFSTMGARGRLTMRPSR